jgi:uncharacterized protein YceK
MRPVIVISLVLATLTGCAGTLKYERAKQHNRIQTIDSDTVYITPMEVSDVAERTYTER